MDINNWMIIGIIFCLLIGTILAAYQLNKLNNKLKKLTKEITQTTTNLKRAR